MCPMPSRTTAGALGAIALALVMVAAVAPGAAAGVEGELTYDLGTLDEARVEASVSLSGEDASELRAWADLDGNGHVSGLETAEAYARVEDELLTPNGTYRVDGISYEPSAVRMSLDGLNGEVGARWPVTLTVSIEAQIDVEDGQQAHMFTLQAPPVALSQQGSFEVAVQAPEGYVIGEVQGLEKADDCQAHGSTPNGNLAVELVPAEGACPRLATDSGFAGVAVLFIVVAIAAACGRYPERT